MAMTNETMNPAPKAVLSTTAEAVKAAAAKLQAQAKAEEERLRQAAIKPEGSPLDVAQPLPDVHQMVDVQENEQAAMADTQKTFRDQVTAEEVAAVKQIAAEVKAQASGKSIKDLTEDDAYNLEVAIVAKNMGSPDFLKISLKDPNYVARWCNRNPVRMSQLVGQGFRMVKPDEVYNLDSLDMFLDAQGNFVYADLVAMKIPKNIYYAGLRRAYLKSLHATNNRKAAEAGAAVATTLLKSALTGAEHTYMAEHAEAGSKPIYNPNLGV